MTNEQAEMVLEILSQHAGFRGDVPMFMHAQTRSVCPEYRFQGSLGFGGKLYREGDRMWVSCYREDETPDRFTVIERTNAALSALSLARSA